MLCSLLTFIDLIAKGIAHMQRASLYRAAPMIILGVDGRGSKEQRGRGRFVMLVEEFDLDGQNLANVNEHLVEFVRVLRNGIEYMVTDLNRTHGRKIE